ncbi:hypothetical protein BD410DRAFT_796371 [Rickenella mellea]|uniref:Uncharacterized protein n=1 Tax=Rickenella mellea TaxID=50990 RepID=A0A4Y7PKA6_9AGAM|nr:hypothetical protein BD410DRAFT_796371 [Rickenella mellea]
MRHWYSAMQAQSQATYMLHEVGRNSEQSSIFRTMVSPHRRVFRNFIIRTHAMTVYPADLCSKRRSSRREHVFMRAPHLMRDSKNQTVRPFKSVKITPTWIPSMSNPHGNDA